MARKWNLGRWGTFRWGHSADFETLLARKDGVHVHRRIKWELDAGTQDITQYFLEGGEVSQEKERAQDRITAGDSVLVFSNASGVFTETSSSSFLNAVNYHNRNITIEAGIELPDGTIEYHKVATMKVRAVTFSSDNNRVQIRVYDQVSRLLTEKVNRRPATMVAAFGGSNVGNGTVTDIDTKPFKTKTENWTLTCTLAGGDNTATFSVVGSVSGNIGTATSGTEFSHASSTGGVKFTVRAGATDWAVDDTITWSTVQMMEWAATNPLKIVWSILTGTIYDTAAAEDWATRTPQLDSTQSNANTDIDWASFQAAVDAADDDLFTIKGFVPWDYNLTQVLEEILAHFLGALFVDPRGRITVKIFKPELFATIREFEDTAKTKKLSYIRDLRDLVNWCAVKYRKTDVWPWSDEDEIEGLDGLYVATHQDSHDDLEQWSVLNLTSRWYNSQGDHVAYMATRIVDKYGIPPRRFTIRTGLDALDVEIGDVVTVTDSKLGFTEYPLEVMRKDADYAASPVAISVQAEDTGTFGINWAFMGSEADEGDGLSPQAADFASASATDKYFAYLSQDGGSGGAGPDYYMF